MYVLFDLEKSLNNLMDPVKDFMSKNGDNPFIWFLIIGGGLLIFAWAFQSLQKEK